jgi:hypothetical protein
MVPTVQGWNVREHKNARRQRTGTYRTGMNVRGSNIWGHIVPEPVYMSSVLFKIIEVTNASMKKKHFTVR